MILKYDINILSSNIYYDMKYDTINQYHKILGASVLVTPMIS